MKFKYDMQMLQTMTLFEKVTKSKLKDFVLFGEKYFFIVQKGQLFRALGKNKANIVKLEELLKRKVKIVEFADTPAQFIINAMAPLKVVDIKEDNGIFTVTGPDQKTRGLMIGARAQNLRSYESIVQKYYPDVKEIKVI